MLKNHKNVIWKIIWFYESSKNNFHVISPCSFLTIKVGFQNIRSGIKAERYTFGISNIELFFMKNKYFIFIATGPAKKGFIDTTKAYLVWPEWVNFFKIVFIFAIKICDLALSSFIFSAVFLLTEWVFESFLCSRLHFVGAFLVTVL